MGGKDVVEGVFVEAERDEECVQQDSSSMHLPRGPRVETRKQKRSGYIEAINRKADVSGRGATESRMGARA